MSEVYVHGYSAAEATRLTRQANILAPFIHAGVVFPPRSKILEAGCGIGAQTVELAMTNMQSRIISIDRSADSVAIAQERTRSCELNNIGFQVADINELPFEDAEFDGVFLCFVLEHLPQLMRALDEIKRVLKPGAKVHVFEGDHGSVLACPSDPAITRLVAAVVQNQSLYGGDAQIGRRLCPILTASGFQQVSVQPCIAYSDFTRPAWIEEFTQATFIDQMALQRETVLERLLLTEVEWREGIDALLRTKSRQGTFSYTFFRATAVRL
jgi:SAM-dependent methyltransferase